MVLVRRAPRTVTHAIDSISDYELTHGIQVDHVLKSCEVLPCTENVWSHAKKIYVRVNERSIIELGILAATKLRALHGIDQATSTMITELCQDYPTQAILA